MSFRLLSHSTPKADKTANKAADRMGEMPVYNPRPVSYTHLGIKEFTNYVNKKNSGPKGEIKDLKKRIAGIESGEIECEDKEAEIAGCRAKMAEAESKLFKPIVG